MEDISERFTINLQLGGQLYPVTIRRDEEEIYREAAKMITSKLNLYKTRFPNQGNEKYMFMTLLDITLNLLKNKEANDTAPYEEALTQLMKEVDETIRNK